MSQWIMSRRSSRRQPVLLRWLSRLEEGIALACLALTCTSILIGAIGRAIGNPVSGSAELAQLFLIWTCVFAANLTLRQGGHVRIDMLLAVLPNRLRSLINAISLVMMLAFLAALAYYSYPLAMSNWQRPLGIWGLSYGYVTLALPVGAALMFLSLLYRTWRRGLNGSLEPDYDPADMGGEP